MKLPVPDLAEVRQRLERLGARCVQPVLFEENWVLDDVSGTLAGAGELLRLRQWGPESTLTYKGPARFAAGVKSRTELETTVGDASAMRQILGALGLAPVRRYQKRREVWRLAGGVVALDETPIGCFVELEGDLGLLLPLAARLDLDPATAVRGTYLDLWRSYRAAHPDAPADMVFP